MTLNAQLYWSFRSPYSYLATKRYRQIAETYDVDVEVKPVYPIAIRNPDFFSDVNPLWIPYLLKDIARIAEHEGLGIAFPRPDPVVMNNETRVISPDQPHIFWLTRLGIEAAARGKGLAFLDEVSTLIWGSGVDGWHEDDHLANAATRAGLDLEDMRNSITGNENSLDDIIASNQKDLEAAGHWGVPTFVIDGEPFFGQDRIELVLWRMKQLGLAERS
jgi:2-hydroxychromene-2-carboxylate isomerase